MEPITGQIKVPLQKIKNISEFKEKIEKSLDKKISEVLNNKPISPEDELADALGDMARDIALIEPNPRERAGGWLTCRDRSDITQNSELK